MPLTFDSYDASSAWDELLTPKGRARPGAANLLACLKSLDAHELQERRLASELAIKEMGISFTVYFDSSNIDRAWSFDIIPRIIRHNEWQKIEQGLQQRLRALNHFINDVYNEQHILKDEVVPADLILKSKNYLAACHGIEPPHGVWANICGTDLVRDSDGGFYVLEDNLRVPSGVAYMIENRQVTKRTFPELFQNNSILPVDDYPLQLFEMLTSLSPRSLDYPEIVVLTPGIYNSAYFEHSYLAQKMGTELVEGQDLFVGKNECVYMYTVDGPRRIDVIYRRVGDAFLDPGVFAKESLLGVPGIMKAWRAGKVAIANAPGSGVADDKVIYAYVPQIIQYYLNEKPILPNVKTYLCSEPDQRAYVLNHLDQLVVKPANESGGYGMLVGPHESKQKRDQFAKLIRANPRNYIAQPTLQLSTAPVLTEGGFAPRHLDLRPFILQGESMNVTAGGLTRVAMKEGSLVVNSSQGGGSKDTWVIETGKR